MSEYGRYKLQCAKAGYHISIKCNSRIEAIAKRKESREAGFKVVMLKELKGGKWEVVD